MTIRQQLVPANLGNHPNKRMTPRYITIHTTGNRDAGANAASNANYMYHGSGGRQASWHYSVDDKEAVQTLPDNWQGWHCGDGSGPGNTSSIGIEMCVNNSSKWRTVCENTATLVVKLMREHNIPMDHVVQHNHWSGKNCPRELRENTWGIDWNEFLGMVRAKYNAHASTPAPAATHSTPAPAPASSTTLRVNQRVQIKTTARTYATGQIIPDSIKGAHATYTIQQLDAAHSRALLKEIMSWVKYSDLTVVGSTPPPLTFDVNTKVKVKMSATKYATGQTIPASVKGKVYTVQQEESDRVLLKEIVSWMLKKDLERP